MLAVLDASVQEALRNGSRTGRDVESNHSPLTVDDPTKSARFTETSPEEKTMPQGRDPLHFNRREAMLLSVAAGRSVCLAPPIACSSKRLGGLRPRLCSTWSTTLSLSCREGPAGISMAKRQVFKRTFSVPRSKHFQEGRQSGQNPFCLLAAPGRPKTEFCPDGRSSGRNPGICVPEARCAPWRSSFNPEAFPAMTPIRINSGRTGVPGACGKLLLWGGDSAASDEKAAIRF